ncbi:pyridoxamine 5'-phosphate oxidase family protein [Cytophagaceae bacterium YF14B1]|uniref:Pyridoxamine 5'-phosphate oxidase family protein n=1 Tax=Xanthocytophaga flava TaxID=3048013 RepID=A0AAE3QX77_9BACT|nr:pyridoxamine 5'-phosphate oxidase family protein [Xanthocytophaga flavus]MDJ1485083.1 pyridoxamine 5'-phosphate oxidase family protein [Xanthocytophaga flavus]
MGKQFAEIDASTREFIENQKIFFVGTAAPDGRVNVSPKGMDTLRILGSNRVVWLNLTGSGNETAAHLQESNRMTLMFCAFEGKPNILRLYGTASMIYAKDDTWTDLITLFPPIAGARQIIDVSVDLVQSSCGMAVPFMDFQSEREELMHWAEKQGPEKIEEYWSRKNRYSIDGKPTGM